MGFTFIIFSIYILLGASLILILLWIIFKNANFLKTLIVMWLGLITLALILSLGRWLCSKTILNKEDYYGKYIIDRDYFKGHQADWQYHHFRFEITEQDSIKFYVTEKDQILKTYTGTVETTVPYNSARLIIHMDEPTHHIMSSNPTTFRDSWGFYLVFYSPKFDNLFFKKGSYKINP